MRSWVRTPVQCSNPTCCIWHAIVSALTLGSNCHRGILWPYGFPSKSIGLPNHTSDCINFTLKQLPVQSSPWRIGLQHNSMSQTIERSSFWSDCAASVSHCCRCAYASNLPCFRPRGVQHPNTRCCPRILRHGRHGDENIRVRKCGVVTCNHQMTVVDR